MFFCSCTDSLHITAASGNVDSVREFITIKGYLPDCQDVYGNTPLYYATLHGHCEMIKVLINEFSCDVNIKGMYGNSLVHAACWNGHLDCVRMLVTDFGCDPMERNVHNDSPVHIAAQFGHESIIKLLVGEFDCSAWTKGQYGRTPLHVACQGGHANVVRLLMLQIQCEQSRRDEHGNAPIHIAARYGQEHVIKLLVEEFGCNPGEKNEYESTPLHAACEGGHANIVHMLILEMHCEHSVKDEYGNAPIHIAAAYGQEYVLKLLVEEFGCNAEEKGEYGRTPLHLACGGGHSNVVNQLILKMQCEQSGKDEHGNAPIHIAALHGQEHIIKLLVKEFGCNAGEKNRYGSTPLHAACQGGHANAVCLFILEMQCERSAKDEHGNAPIHIAALHGHEHVIRLLVEEFGCNAGEKNEYGSTPLHAACQGGHENAVRMLILEMQCEQSGKDDNGDAPIHFAAQHAHEHIIKVLVEEFGCSAGQKGWNRRTPLHFACQGGHVNVVCLLVLEMKCNRSVKDEHGNTPIHIAALHGQEHVIKLLVEQFGCHAEEQGEYGRTPLHLACEGGHANVVRLLILEMQCERSGKDGHGNAPIHIAALHGHEHVIKLLVEEFGCNAEEKAEYGRTPLHLACEGGHANVVRLLILEMQCERSGKDGHGNAPIHIAALHGHEHVIKVLVEEFGCNAEEKGEYGRTPLHLACGGGHSNVVRLLILEMQCERLAKDKHGNGPVHIAALHGQEHIIKLLAEEFGCNAGERNRYRITPLHAACEGGHVDVVRQLILEMQCELSPKDECRSTPIHNAALHGQKHVIKLLVEEFGCNAGEMGKYRWTPLHFACQGGHANVVLLLIAEMQCNRSAKDVDGNAPIHIAALHGQEYIIKLLVERFGCNAGEKNRYGITPLHLGCQGGHVNVVRSLITDFNVDIMSTDIRGRTAFDIAILHGYITVVKQCMGYICTEGKSKQLYHACRCRNVDLIRLLITEFKCDPFGNTPLHIACQNNDLDLVHMLITEFPVYNETIDKMGNTPLKIAVMYENIGIVKEFVGHVHIGKQSIEARQFLEHTCKRRNVELLRILLLSFGCDPNLLNESNIASPLHIACEYCDLDLVHTLISEFHVDTEIVDEVGDTPLMIAVMSENIGIVKEFVGHVHIGKQSVEAKQFLEHAYKRRNVDLWILLLSFGCDPSLLNESKITSPLHIACWNNDLDLVHMLITEFHVDTETVDIMGDTSLKIAVMSENINIIKEFVGHVHIGKQSVEAGQFLQHACERENVDLLRILLLSFGCDPNLLNESETTTPLHVACENEAVDLVHALISEFGVDTSVRFRGASALETAVRTCSVKVIREFIGHVNIEDHPSAFFDACYGGSLEVVRMLISEFGCDVMAENNEGLTALECAIEANNIEVMNELLGHVDLCNRPFHALLHFSIENIAADATIKLLLQRGVNPMSRDEDGYLPIHVAARVGRISIVSTLVNDFNCDPAVRGPNGTTPLHEACTSSNLDLIRLLIMDMKCDSCCQDDDGNTPMHFAARSSTDTTPVIRDLAQQNGALLECLNNKRQTPLHLAAGEGWHSENIKILSELGCSHIATDIDGNTPLHLAAMAGRLNGVKELMEQCAVPLDCWNNNHQLPIHLALEKKHDDIIVNVFLLRIDGNTPLHIATIHDEPERLRLLIQQSENGSPDCLNGKKQTPLHFAAAKGNERMVKMLLSEYSCSPTVTDIYGNTPLHMAALSDRPAVLKELAKQYGSPPDCQNINQQTPLHLAIAGGHLEVVSMLMSEFHCNINIADIDGNTILHLAVRNENADVDLVISLLSEYKVYPNPRNSSGHTPLYYATLNRNTRIVSELVKYNCNPAAFDEDYRTLEKIYQEKLSSGSLTKVFVIGNKYAGKSTLIEALRNETQQSSCFTENVIPHTAGIIPSVHCSEQYGRVLFYDFAGDPEYYSSHAAALERLLTSSCHIFLLLEDFSAEEEAILQTLGYWLTFISYNSKDLQTKSQVVIVGSHADITESKGENSEKKVCELFIEISSKFERYHPYIEMVGYCSLDCRKSQSTGTEKLYNLLKHCRVSYSAEDRPLSVGAVLLLGILQRDFKGVIACEVSQICRHIQLTEMYLPQGVVTVYSYLQELNAQGVILILGSREGLSKEWVILDVSTFLATVHKNLFSYTSLSHVCSMRSLSNLGLISESDLKNVLDKFDVKLLKQCLKYLQYCIELDDSEILQKVFGNYHTTNITSKSRSICGPSEDSSENTGESDPSVHITASDSSLLFFPALLKGIQRSSMNWFGKESYTSCKGWYIECSREYDYFPPRFLHVLLLRLAFNFTLPVCNTKKGKNVDICSRRCIMWKSGIHWLMKTDVECVVEVVKQSKGVVVMIKSEREFDADCSCTFSEIVGKVLEVKQEFCHSLIAKEYLIHPDDMSQDIIPSFKDLHLFDMKEVKEALTENQRAVVSADGQRILPLSRLQVHRMWSKLLWYCIQVLTASANHDNYDQV